MNSTEALREFAVNNGHREYFANTNGNGFNANPRFLSDLTALISEHYYPKEFVRWMFKGCPFIIGENGAGNIIAFSVRDGKQFTFDELFNYWKENEQ